MRSCRGAQPRPDLRRYAVRGHEERTRADEYHGREAVKQTTRAAQEEFTGELEAKAEQTDADLRDPSLYINRELSMLDFFERVLDEARDTNNPLLERVKFVGIVGSILGEFFMVRIAGLRQQVEAGVTEAAADGYTPQQLLPIAQERAWGIMKAARQCFSDLRPELEAAGIHIVDFADLDAGQKRRRCGRYYEEKVLPGAHAAGVRPGPAVPAHLQHEPQPRRAAARRQRRRAVRARQGAGLAAAARAGACRRRTRTRTRTAWSTQWFTWLEQVIAANLATLFPGMDVVESHAFRVTRDAELAIQELEADDLLETIEQFVRRRRFGSVIRVTIDETMPRRACATSSPRTSSWATSDVYAVRSPLGLSSLWGAGSIDRPELKYAPLVQSVPPSLAGLEGSELFAAIRHRDVLLHHPYDSFDPVVEFLRAAANDPDVLGHQADAVPRAAATRRPSSSSWRRPPTARTSPCWSSSRRASTRRATSAGPRRWSARARTSCTASSGSRRTARRCRSCAAKGDRIRRYTHLGTGNYNSVTTKQYTDLGYLTADDDIGADANLVFNHLTGGGQATEYRKLLVAPVNLRQGIADRIEREIAHAEAGREAHLIFKMNSLVDKPMIRKLYRASQAGVKIELNVRGMCCLRPGVPGVSENITEQSIVGRFLEHSRIYWFRNGGDEEVMLGSADLMPRNLNRRVEIIFPVQDKGIMRRIRDEILPTYLADNMKTRVLAAGRLVDARLARGRARSRCNAQEWFVARAREQAVDESEHA